MGQEITGCERPRVGTRSTIGTSEAADRLLGAGEAKDTGVPVVVVENVARVGEVDAVPSLGLVRVEVELSALAILLNEGIAGVVAEREAAVALGNVLVGSGRERSDRCDGNGGEESQPLERDHGD